MYIWLVERTDIVDYDEHSALIVVAETEAVARLIHPYGTAWDENTGWDHYESSWPVKPEDLKVTKLGTAVEGIEADAVLLASFRAG